MTKEFAQQLDELDIDLDGYLTPDECREVRGDLKEAAEGFKLLASYAEGKEMAMICRLEGKIEHARRFEAACEEVYNQLPAWAKW